MSSDAKSFRVSFFRSRWKPPRVSRLLATPQAHWTRSGAFGRSREADALPWAALRAWGGPATVRATTTVAGAARSLRGSEPPDSPSGGAAP